MFGLAAGRPDRSPRWLALTLHVSASLLNVRSVLSTAAAPAVLRCALGEASAAPRPRLGLRSAPAPRPTAGGALNFCAAAAVVIEL